MLTLYSFKQGGIFIVPHLQWHRNSFFAVSCFCLLGVYRPTQEFFTCLETVITITCNGLQILTYTRHLWPLSREGSLECHTYCDMWHPFIMVISEDPWYSHVLPSPSPAVLATYWIPERERGEWQERKIEREYLWWVMDDIFLTRKILCSLSQKLK